jgi:hypothetical protein
MPDDESDKTEGKRWLFERQPHLDEPASGAQGGCTSIAFLFCWLGASVIAALFVGAAMGLRKGEVSLDSEPVSETS